MCCSTVGVNQQVLASVYIYICIHTYIYIYMCVYEILSITREWKLFDGTATDGIVRDEAGRHVDLM